MTSTYLLRQADALINLSRATFDLTVAGRLRVLAAEFRVKGTGARAGRPHPPRIRAGQALPAALTATVIAGRRAPPSPEFICHYDSRRHPRA